MIIPLLTDEQRQRLPLLECAGFTFAGVIAVGVLILVISRWLLLRTLEITGEAAAAVERSLGESGEYEAAKWLAIAARVSSIEEKLIRRHRTIVVSAIIGDILFYGGFLVGLGFLVVAISRR